MFDGPLKCASREQGGYVRIYLIHTDKPHPDAADPALVVICRELLEIPGMREKFIDLCQTIAAAATRDIFGLEIESCEARPAPPPDNTN